MTNWKTKGNTAHRTKKEWKKPDIELISKDTVKSGSVPLVAEGVLTINSIYIGSGTS